MTDFVMPSRTDIVDYVSGFEWKTGETPLTSVEFLVSAHVAYFVAAMGLAKYVHMRETKLAALDTLTKFHNVGMCLISAVLLALLGVASSGDNRFSDVDTLVCHRPGPNVGLLPFAVYLFYLSKVLTFVDTMLLIGGRKRVAWLHVVHHSLTMVTVWQGMNSRMPTEVVNMGLNCMAHVLLYLYFAYPAKSLRPLLTGAQLVQFGVGLASVAYNLSQRYVVGQACDGTLTGEVHGVAVYALFLTLFGRFFYVRYVRDDGNSDEGDLGPCGCGENPCAVSGEDERLEVPSNLMRRSSKLALEVLSKALVCGVVGSLVTAYMPWYFAPVGILITGMAFSWAYIIGQDCALDNFFPSSAANEVIGTLLMLPLLRPLADARNALEPETSNSHTSSAANFSLVMLFCGGLAAYSFLDEEGFSNVARYWLLPFVIMHLNLRSFSNTKSGTHSFNLLFPELEHITDSDKAALADATADGSSSDSDSGEEKTDDPHPFGDPVSLTSLLHRVPIYHLPKAAEEVKSAAAARKQVFSAVPTVPMQQASVPNIIDRVWALLPSRRISRDLLFWRRRDIALWIAAVAIILLISVSKARDYAWVPLALLVPFVGPKSRAAQAVTEWQTVLDESVSSAETPILKLMSSFLRTMNWPMGIYITLNHVGACYGIQRLTQCHWQTLVFAFWLWPFSGLGITAGVHRLWSHRSYKASPQLRSLLMIMNSVANQGTIYHWARDHRVHHKYSETDADPHNAKRGFIFAHIGWLYVKKHKKVIEAGKKLNFDDLLKDGPVMLQKNLDPFWNLFWCFVAPMLVCKYGWGEENMNGFLVAGVLRYVTVLHFTWLVNSAAHLYGGHPYDEHSNPAENPWVSIAAVGEGWHNWHHAYPFDYAASELGISDQFNPTKMFIDFFAAIGHVTDRKRATKQWERKMNRQAGEKAGDGGKALESLHGAPFFKVRHVDYVPGSSAEGKKVQ